MKVDISSNLEHWKQAIYENDSIARSQLEGWAGLDGAIMFQATRDYEMLKDEGIIKDGKVIPLEEWPLAGRTIKGKPIYKKFDNFYNRAEACSLVEDIKEYGKKYPTETEFRNMGWEWGSMSGDFDVVQARRKNI